MSALDDVAEAPAAQRDELTGMFDEADAGAREASQPMSESQELMDEFALDEGEGSSADELLGELEQFGEELDDGMGADSLQELDAGEMPGEEVNLFDELEEFQEEQVSAPADNLEASADNDIFDLGAGDAGLTELADDLEPSSSAAISSFTADEETRYQPERETRESRQQERDKSKFIQQELEGSQTGRKLVWSLLIVLLLAIMVGQVMYFKRAELMKYPQVVPALEAMCSVLSQYQVPCDLPLPKNLEAISMEEREVRSHPNTPNALLISAKIVNRADFEQPYPLLELSFSDMNQKLIARRTFKPKEYLGKEVDTTKGMPIDVPVRVVLEIVDPGPDAVNFEFNYR